MKCQKCQQPPRACKCSDPDFANPALAYLMGGPAISTEHPFSYSRRARDVARARRDKENKSKDA